MTAKPSRIPIAVALVAALALAATGHASPAGEEITSSWAKLNACAPTELGARAQLAGDGSSKQLHVRFTAQWRSPDGWVPVLGAATSPWQHAGSARYTWSQAGWTFALAPPQPEQSYELRAVAELEWRDGGSVARSETHVTGTCALSG